MANSYTSCCRVLSVSWLALGPLLGLDLACDLEGPSYMLDTRGVCAGPPGLCSSLHVTPLCCFSAQPCPTYGQGRVPSPDSPQAFRGSSTSQSATASVSLKFRFLKNQPNRPPVSHSGHSAHVSLCGPTSLGHRAGWVTYH